MHTRAVSASSGLASLAYLFLGSVVALGLYLLAMPPTLAVAGGFFAAGLVAYLVGGERTVALNYAVSGIVLTLIWVIALLLLASPARAAESPSSTVDLAPVLDASIKVVADLVIIIGGVLATWLAFELKKKWGIDITKQVSDLEANYRDTLHSAAETWGRGALAKFGAGAKFDIGSPELAYVINGLSKSAPDAVDQLRPTEEWVATWLKGRLGVATP